MKQSERVKTLRIEANARGYTFCASGICFKKDKEIIYSFPTIQAALNACRDGAVEEWKN